jgi:Phosphoesterase family
VKSLLGRGNTPVSRSAPGRRLRRGLAVGTAVTAGVVGALVLSVGASASTPRTASAATTPSYSDQPAPPPGYRPPLNDGLGVRPGQIKHVWLIVLENKSYDAAFTGLNDSTYLWQTLPAQGALLQNYYGTGHSSLDNYLSLASGQATITDTQDDCPAYDALSGSVDTSGSLATNPNYGQFKSAAGPEAPAGQNGCVYPTSVPTIFNQLDAAHVPWKLYAQDLGNPDPTGSATHDAGTQYCGAPDATVGPTGGSSTSYPNPSSANATDQYVAKHNPLPWFESVLQSGDCDAQHLANLLDPSNGLYHDLQSQGTTPGLSLIIPNNCSNGHDAVCAGNNLSGGWSNPTTPNAPVNYTGGLYSADLFLEHIIPEIEASPAFRDGGLIDVTFDEAYPQFTYSNSFANSTLYAPTAATSVGDDSAGETLWDRSVPYEPTGPNTPNVTASSGQQLSAGPGFNEYLDRPDSSTAAGTDLVPCTSTGLISDGQCYLGGGSTTPGARIDSASAATGTPTIADNSVNLTDEGRTVTGSGIPSGAYVGTVTDTPATATASSGNGGFAHTGSFELVTSSGAPLDTSGPVTSITLGAQTAASDPLYDAYDPTTGGGDSGDVLISPYIKPGTVSTRYYNHYSTLRTLEDIFGVAHASPGLDGAGHIGYAAQPGLAPLGSDVFTNPRGEPMWGPWYGIRGLSGGHRSHG